MPIAGVPGMRHGGGVPMTGSRTFVWKDEYAVGDGRIDRRHATPPELANAIAGACAARCGKDVFEKAFGALFHYTRYHFECEEMLFRERLSGSLADHRRRHRRLIEEIHRLRSASCIGLLQDTAESLDDWVMQRLVPHMINEDRALDQRG